MIDRIPMPSRKFMALVLVILFSLNGLWSGLRHLPNDDWYVQAAYIGGSVAGSFAKGVIVGGLLWLCAKGAENFRLKAPAPWATKLGIGIYLLGSGLFIYLLGLAVYTFFLALSAKSDAAQSVVFFLVLTGLSYWFASRAVSYVLGR